MSLKIDSILINSTDHDEMPPYAAFHLGLNCLPKYMLTGMRNEKDKHIDLCFSFVSSMFSDWWLDTLSETIPDTFLNNVCSLLL